MKKILIHTCCAPCLCYHHEILQNEEYDITAYWYNPNIHPHTEYKMRMDALYKFQAITNINVVYEDYDIKNWFSAAKEGWENDNKPLRCKNCYEMRLNKTVEYAKSNDFSDFTTTLLYSKYQFHDTIIELCKDLSEKHNINFLYKDFREGWKKGIELSHKYELYRQRYCGCIFSEGERKC